MIRSVQVWLLNPLAYGAEVVGKCFGTTFKLNLFNVRVLTMHRWFNISAAERDLHYKVRLLFLKFVSCSIIFFYGRRCVSEFVARFHLLCIARCHSIRQFNTDNCSPSSPFVRAGKTLYPGSRWRPLPFSNCVMKLGIALRFSFLFPSQTRHVSLFRRIGCLFS